MYFLSKIELAVIGGSGFYEPALFDDSRELTVDTPYGQINVIVGKSGGVELAFLPRHGPQHSVLPHQINYQAIIWGLHLLGVRRIIATSAVGSMNEQLVPGSLVLINQFLDFTKQRPFTFFASGEARRAHIDVSEPYCPEIRAATQTAAAKLQISVFDAGCYVCTEGPRYETSAEIRAFQLLGGDVVGMTGVPEVILARELGVCYANLSIVTNWAAGLGSQQLSHLEVEAVMRENLAQLRKLIIASLAELPAKPNCHCCLNTSQTI
jgi:5'-methylthioadenosine phosphorylase